jgi:hypothetical protein
MFDPGWYVSDPSCQPATVAFSMPLIATDGALTSETRLMAKAPSWSQEG